MANIDITKNVNHTTLSAGGKSALVTAAAAIRAAFTAVKAEKKKENVRAILSEIIRNGEET